MYGVILLERPFSVSRYTRRLGCLPIVKVVVKNSTNISSDPVQKS